MRSATGSYTYLFFVNGALFDNQPGASFAFADDSTYVQSNGGTPAGGTFLNEGTLTKAGTNGSTAYSDFGSSITFNSTSPGTIAVNSGELTFEGGGTISTTSPITAASGASLEFYTGSYTFPVGATFSGAGTLQLDGSATLTNPTSTTIADGLATNFSGGTITGAGTFNFTTALNWTGGLMSSTGVTNSSGGLTIGQAAGSGSYETFLDQRTFNNSGAATIVRSATGSYTYLYFSDGALFDNQSGASFAFADDTTGIINDGGTPLGGTFLNAGTLTKAGTTGTSQFQSEITFTNTGTVNVQSSELSIQGAFTNLSGSTLTGGTFIVSGTLQVPGTGTITTLASSLTLSGTSYSVINANTVNAIPNLTTVTSAGAFGPRERRGLHGWIGVHQRRPDVGTGSTLTAGVSYTQTGGSTTVAGGTLVSTASTLALNGGVLASASPARFTATSTTRVARLIPVGSARPGH